MNPFVELHALSELLPEPNGERFFRAAEHVPRETVPQPYHKLLVHDSHMTVTMEQHHGGPVGVSVLDEKREGDLYYRKILLTAQESGQVVQFGIVRFNLGYVTEAVREEILSRQTPLGRVLINHNVLRHIDLGAVLRMELGAGLAGHFGVEEGKETYGRMATIFCNNQPAVDLLEVSAPLE